MQRVAPTVTTTMRTQVKSPTPMNPIRQKSPVGALENVTLDDYDEETDEFAKPTKPVSIKQLMAPEEKKKSEASKPLKSVEQRQREKNIKEIKMYYWTKVDSGDTNEVFKILSYAKQQFNETELFEIVNCTNSDGFTPLHLAASEGHAPLIEILVKYTAQVDARTNNFRTPLHIACLRGNLSVI